MIAQLAELVVLTQDALWVGFVVFLRIAAMVAVMPAFGEQVIPMRVKLAVAIAFTAIIAPAVSPETPPVPDDLLRAMVPLLVETITGLFFGILLRFFIFALQIAGTIAAQSTSLSQIFGGTAGVDPQPAMGHILVTGGLAIAAIMGVHVQFAAYGLMTYQMVPLGIAIESGVALDIGLLAVSSIFALAFKLAAPFLIASLVYNVTLGVINRAMPQLMVSFVGAPAITAGGLFLLLLTAPLMLSLWMDAFAGVIMNPESGWP